MRARAAQEVKQKRFHLVVLGVTGGDDAAGAVRGGLSQECVPPDAGGILGAGKR
jgi:hypothetical protein